LNSTYATLSLDEERKQNIIRQTGREGISSEKYRHTWVKCKVDVIILRYGSKRNKIFTENFCDAVTTFLPHFMLRSIFFCVDIRFTVSCQFTLSSSTIILVSTSSRSNPRMFLGENSSGFYVGSAGLKLIL
jgi:hypothetical protein